VARESAARLRLPRVTTEVGDASEVTGLAATGSVFFLYCPFSGARLARLLTTLEPLARVRALRIGTLDVPLPEEPWLDMDSPRHHSLRIYRSSALA
jgi:hypothetical protein